MNFLCLRSLLVCSALALPLAGEAHPHGSGCSATVYFENDEFSLDGDDRVILGELAQGMTGPTYNVTGYTDALSSAAYNDALSQARVQSVTEYLTGLGIDRTRLAQAVARGERDVKTQAADPLMRKVEVSDARCGGHSSHHIRSIDKFGTRDGSNPDENYRDLVGDEK